LPDGTTNYYVDILANRSSWIKAIGTGEGDNVPSAALTGSFTSPIYESLSGGADGVGEASIPFGKIALGYDLYKDPNDVDISALICGKSTSANLANYLTQNIAESRKDCVVYASPTYANVVAPANPTDKMNNAIAFRNSLTSSSYLVIDTGYKYRYDKYNDIYRWVPLNGDIAGLAARVESWESPAGYKRGVIKNVVKLAFNPNKAQRDQLYGSDVNPVISQVGQGVLLFGDKTALGTATGSAFTRINVRRLFITVEKAIATVAASFLFDFNDEFTQTQFKNLVEPFLRDIQGRRGIIDFRVVSDATVNTPDVIDRNIFRGNIFIKPARSINVIELTFVATRTGVEFDEIVGQPL
jgi:phage tail sheath protein FI